MLENIVAEIDAEISRLQKAKVLLTGISAPAKRGPGRPAKSSGTTTAPKKAKRRKMSAEAREKIRQAQIKRWAATKKSTKKSAKE